MQYQRNQTLYFKTLQYFVIMMILSSLSRSSYASFAFTSKIRYSSSCVIPKSFLNSNSHGNKIISNQNRIFSKMRQNEKKSLTYQLSMSSDLSSTSLSRHPFKAPKSSPSDSDTSKTNYSWNKLGLMQELISALNESFIDTPTPIQHMAIPQILSGGEGVAFAAATGSGKTLAYLLPIIQLLKGQEIVGEKIGTSENNKISKQKPIRKNKRPRAIVLAPTRELAVQILAVLKSLSHKAKFSSELLIGGDDYGKQRKRLESRPVDIVVATPGRLVKHMAASNIFLGSVSYVVLDEVDTMLEQGFQADIAKLLHPMLYQKSVKGVVDLNLKETAPMVILTTATLTNAVKRLLGDKTVKPSKNYKIHTSENNASHLQTIRLPPNLRIVEAPGLHRAVPTLQQIFVDVGQMDKLSLLTDAIQSHRNSKQLLNNDDDASSLQQLTLVFCNTVASCRAAEHALAEAGLKSLCYHGELNSSARAENLEKFRLAETSILVCTDIAARGLDVPNVDHVVMFDFPLNPLDYLHRAGRTARGTSNQRNSEGFIISNKGKVTALVAKRDKVLAKAIENAVMRGEQLDNLTGRKTDYLPTGKLGSKNRPTRGRNTSRTSTKNTRYKATARKTTRRS